MPIKRISFPRVDGCVFTITGGGTLLEQFIEVTKDQGVSQFDLGVLWIGKPIV